MKPEDRALLNSGRFDREAWTAMWDRLPARMRRSTASIVLQKLHAIESGGEWSFRMLNESADARSGAGGLEFDEDQPGDVIIFSGSLRIGPD